VATSKKVLVRVQDLTMYFPLKKTSLFQRQQYYVRANEGVTIDIYEGETFGLVGESGSGKTTLGRVILQLYKQTSGSVLYYGKTLEEFMPKYFKKTIRRLSAIIARYNQLSNQRGENLLAEYQARTLDKAALKIVERYADAVRIAGGLVLADNLEEVSKALLDEYEAGTIRHEVDKEMEDLNMQRNTLMGKEDRTEEENKLLAQYDQRHAELSARQDKALSDLEKKQEVLQSLRNKYSVKPNFAETEALRDNGLDLAKLTDEEIRTLRREMQVIFQDPYSSLNPRLTVGQLISEALTAHNIFKRGSELLEKYVLDVMDKCGLQAYMLHRYPHQFSGGQRQRIGIARALSVMPKFVVCDEAVSALDVSIRSQIINLLQNLKEQDNLTYLFITHDLSVVKFISDRVAVMYLGNVVELADSDLLFKKPLHPYTHVLMESIPTTESRRELAVIKGDIPSPINPPSGCKFHTRCQYVTDKCKQVEPEWRELEAGHFVACHYPLGSEQVVQETEGASA